MKIYKIVEVTANICTVFAFAIAVYAFVNPATVSDYLDRVASLAEEANARLADISDDTQEISVDVARVADHVPYWVSLEEVSISLSGWGGGYVVNVRGDNPTNTPVSLLSVVMLTADGDVLLDSTSARMVPPRENFSFTELRDSDVEGVFFLCMAGITALSEEVLYEMREFNPGLVDYQLTMGQPSEPCS